MMLPWQLPPWLGTALALGLGTCVVVAGMALGSRLTRSAVWQRACWEGAILGILVLLATEVTGISAGIVQWWRARDLFPRPVLFAGVRVSRHADRFDRHFRIRQAAVGCA